MNYEEKYLKYKHKYENLLNGGSLFNRSIKRGPKEPCTIKRLGSECSKGYKCSGLELDKKNNIIAHERTICINKYSIPTKKQIAHYKLKKTIKEDDDESSSDDEDPPSYEKIMKNIDNYSQNANGGGFDF